MDILQVRSDDSSIIINDESAPCLGYLSDSGQWAPGSEDTAPPMVQESRRKPLGVQSLGQCRYPKT